MAAEITAIRLSSAAAGTAAAGGGVGDDAAAAGAAGATALPDAFVSLFGRYVNFVMIAMHAHSKINTTNVIPIPINVVIPAPASFSPIDSPCMVSGFANCSIKLISFTSYSGMFPCFLAGRDSLFVLSMSNALMIRCLAVAGSITSST